MSLRTAVFIDGYNLYYGRLRGSGFKWLDLVRFSERLLERRSQNELLTRVTLCTARASATLATHGERSVASQGQYHSALKALHGDRLEIVYGTHSWNRKGIDAPAFRAGKPFNRDDCVRVWKVEEKLTDVNLALSMYRACAKGECDRLIVISNDSDVGPALAAIQADFPAIVRGVVFPLLPNLGLNPNRRKSGTLENLADWHQADIHDDLLAASQMPPSIAIKGKKTLRKPDYW